MFVSTAFMQFFPREAWGVGGNRVLLHACQDGLQVPHLLLRIGDFGWNHTRAPDNKLDFGLLGQIAGSFRNETAFLGKQP
jgi:hypothetical protein